MLCCVVQYRSAASKKSDDPEGSKAAVRAYRSRVMQTEVVTFILNVVNTSAALLLPCCVIHWTQVRTDVLFRVRWSYDLPSLGIKHGSNVQQQLLYPCSSSYGSSQSSSHNVAHAQQHVTSSSDQG